VPDPDPIAGYSPHEHKPLGSYAAFTVVFEAIVATYIVAERKKGGQLAERIPLGDFALLTLATMKVSRVITKERVTSFLRAPFTRYTGEARPGEVSEEPRGTGLRRATGELLICPYCLGQWVAAAFLGGYLHDPAATAGWPRCSHWSAQPTLSTWVTWPSKRRPSRSPVRL
jgi:hypothetical protein